MENTPSRNEENLPFGIKVPKSLTQARLGIGRTGGSLTTREILDFDLAHARARDAVLQPWDIDEFEHSLARCSLTAVRTWPVIRLFSGASDRPTYLKRPDSGRRLDGKSLERLRSEPRGRDLAVIVSDGLSAHAAANQAVLVLEHLVPKVLESGWSLAPLLIVPHARVGISDSVGEALGCRATVILLGERPGLATPESLGAYFTYEPRSGRTDADRNCISNIHPDGLRPIQAAEAIFTLIDAAFRFRQGGVDLSIAMAEPGR